MKYYGVRIGIAETVSLLAGMPNWSTLEWKKRPLLIGRWADGRRVTANDDDRWKLYGATLSDAVHHLKLGIDYTLDQFVGFSSQHGTFCVLFQDLNAWFMDEKGVVKNLKLVVEGAQRISLCERTERVYIV